MIKPLSSLMACSSPRLLGPLGVACISLFLQACHVRTPEFHCKLAASPRENMEVAMSPLALRFEDRSFSFVEERGNQR
ncbi:MAG: hypothetical protein ACK441_09250, partial [Burkholderiales bacterium]